MADLFLALTTGLSGALLFRFALPTGDNPSSIFVAAGFGVLGFCLALVLSPVQSRMQRARSESQQHVTHTER